MNEEDPERDRATQEEDLLTVNKEWQKVGKHNVLSGNTTLGARAQGQRALYLFSPLGLAARREAQTRGPRYYHATAACRGYPSQSPSHSLEVARPRGRASTLMAEKKFLLCSQFLLDHLFLQHCRTALLPIHD